MPLKKQDKMRRSPYFFTLLVIIACYISQNTQAKTWLVGPGFHFKKPSQAIDRAHDGDIIKIVAGVYENDQAVINQNDLTLVGVNGYAHMKSSGGVSGGKAIWVINGKNIRIENIEFSGAVVRDRNGAGIRLQRGSLTIENCYFHDNEMGILTSGNPDIILKIINSEFNRNIQDSRVTKSLSHNIYVGRIAEFTLDNSISRGANYGHQVKSRARNNIIRNNRIFDEGDIASSYLIDLPNGGKATIENNYLYQNKASRNFALISYGAEGMKYQENSLVIKNNVAINEEGVAFLLRNHAVIEVKFAGNQLTNISVTEISGIERDGFWDRMKNKIRDYIENNF